MNPILTTVGRGWSWGTSPSLKALCALTDVFVRLVARFGGSRQQTLAGGARMGRRVDREQQNLAPLLRGLSRFGECELVCGSVASEEDDASPVRLLRCSRSEEGSCCSNRRRSAPFALDVIFLSVLSKRGRFVGNQVFSRQPWCLTPKALAKISLLTRIACD